MNSENQASFRQIFKTTSLFGGVQVITIIVTIVRSKFVAVLLGTAGAGTLGLLNAPVVLISSITGLGIIYSAVRDISEVDSLGNEEQLARLLISFHRWVFFTGFIGMIITIGLSYWLSLWTFGNHNYSGAYVWLSITILLNAISGGQKAQLQGMRKIQYMAKATLIGSILGLITSIPLYYLFGINGIVPAFITSALVSLLLSWYFTKKIRISKVLINFKESLSVGLGMIKLGIILTISIQLGALVTFLINMFISRTGGVVQVGLYSSGMSLIGTSVGLIFTAMGMDYYPKLAAVSSDHTKINNMVNQQAMMSMLIILPIVILLLAIMPIVIKLFLSNEFLEIVPFVNLMVIGVILKAVSYSIGYISFAKGDSKIFFWLEGIMSNGLTLTGSVIGYKIFGLYGIGLAFVINYLIYLLIAYRIVHKRYSFTFNKDIYKVLIKSTLMIITAYLSINLFSSFVLYSAMSIILIVSVIFSFQELYQRMNLKPVIASYLKNIFQKDK